MKVCFVSYCILDQSVRAHPWEGAMQIATDLIENNFGIVQLPCPERIYKGIRRKPMSKNEYDVPAFRKLCKSLATSAIELCKRYEEAGIRVDAIYGVDKSPSCGINKVYVSSNGEKELIDGKGIFMEEIEAELRREGIRIPMIPIDFLTKQK